MRNTLLIAAMLICTCTAARSASAQRAGDPSASQGTHLLSPLISDSLSARMRALGLLAPAAPVVERVIALNAPRVVAECRMPIQRPDSSTQFAATKNALPRFNDRMPTQVSSCVNPLDKSR